MWMGCGYSGGITLVEAWPKAESASLEARIIGPMAIVTLPDPCLVVLVGAAGSGKSTFASRNFASSQILSSDAYRVLVSGDPTDQSANAAAFTALHAALDRRLGDRLTSVIDATNLTRGARRALVSRATGSGVAAVAIVLDLPHDQILGRNAARDRVVPEDVVRYQLAQVRRLVDETILDRDGFEWIVILRDPREVDAVTMASAPPG